jgi:endonuclease/exonuclease/phosphatase family metal-dependent hydrolase
MMRLLVYNIRYGVGPGLRTPISPWDYLDAAPAHLARIHDFIAGWEPDVVGLLEVDGGSVRARGRHQAQIIADRLGHSMGFSCKYAHGSFSRRMPVLRLQGNALLSGSHTDEHRQHFLDCGMKRLVLELETEDMNVFLVHLALGQAARQAQLAQLGSMIDLCERPVVVAGDFNTLGGRTELTRFMQQHDLTDANDSARASYPSWRPRHHLDFILYGSGLELREFHLPAVTLSDHLPLIADLERVG